MASRSRRGEGRSLCGPSSGVTRQRVSDRGNLGRPPEARLIGRSLPLPDRPVEHEDLEHVLEGVDDLTDDNRASSP